MPQLIKCHNCGKEFPHEMLKYWKSVPNSSKEQMIFCKAECSLEHHNLMLEESNAD